LSVTDRLRGQVAALALPAVVPAATDRADAGGAAESANAADPVADRTTWASAAEIDELLSATTEAATQLARIRRGTAALDRVRPLVDQLLENVAAHRRADARLTENRRADARLTETSRADARLTETSRADARLTENGRTDARLNESSRADARTVEDRGTDAGPVEQGVTEPTQPLVENLRAALGNARGRLGEAVDRAEHELRHAREVAEQLRLTPAGTIFNTLERAVRDVAQTEPDKRVVFTAHGGDLRLGPHVLREVRNALLHVVRNAVAHGIETQADRLAAGKPPVGSVVVDVTRQGRRLRFSCRDDGAGFDLTAVRDALRRQRPDLPDPAGTSPGELLDLLQRGGTSTSATVTAVSGRGIGLDVLRAAAQRLGGEVTIDSQPGAGASVNLLVPVSLLALEGLVVGVDGRSVTIPLDAVRRTAWVRPEDVVDTPDGKAILHEGQAVRFAPLSLLLSGTAEGPAGRDPCRAVLVEGAGGTVAVGVDRLIGPAGVIVRPLPLLAPAHPVVAGAALDGDGSPSLVLDPDGLVERLHRTPAPSGAPEPATTPPVLVVDDSLTTRMLEQSILESAGYDVDVAASGEEALEKAHRRAYGLMLVDVEMPGIDGFTVIERIRADAVLHDLPAILVTSRCSPQDLSRGAEVGASGYVIKGKFDQTLLLDRIRTLMSAR
jgi:two-component system chemotaxis sensor kinase CheA